MEDGYYGEIRIFAGTFAPKNWVFCNGQLLSIAQNQVLFSILGTFYGGDGRTTFGIPDLRGRLPIGYQGGAQGPGLSTIPYLGYQRGLEKVTLHQNNLPAHNHNANQVPGGTTTITSPLTAVTTVNVSTANGTKPTADAGDSIATVGNVDGRSFATQNSFDSSAPNTNLHEDTATTTGSTTVNIPNGVNIGTNTPFTVQNPSIGVNYIICVEGLYPSRS